MAVGDKLETVEINGNIFQAVEVESNRCYGCAGMGAQGALCIKLPHCTPDNRKDKKGVIWGRFEKEESPPQATIQKGVTIQEVRAKTLELKNKIYELIQEFEDDTKMVVHGLELTHTQEISGASSTYAVELDVRLN